MFRLLEFKETIIENLNDAFVEDAKYFDSIEPEEIWKHMKQFTKLDKHKGFNDEIGLKVVKNWVLHHVRV